MACGLVRAAISSVYAGDSFSGRSERSKQAIGQAKHIIGQLSDEGNLDRFEEFSQKLMDCLKRTYSGAAECGNNFKVQVWRQFHSIRLTTLCDIWKTFLDAIKCDVDPLLQQYVNQELYSSIIKSRCGFHRTIAAKAASMTTEEENIVRYAAGYVPFALLKKHERHGSESSAYFVECLSGMAINGEESSFLEYTTEWVHRVNRGGLFEVNDTAFSLFLEIELGVWDRLSATLKSNSVETDQKDRLVKFVCEDEDVQFYWSMLSIDIDTEHNAALLLKEIVELWLTIRGFSIAGQWLEMYKNDKALTTKKSKSLRKTLKRGETSKWSTSSKLPKPRRSTLLHKTKKKPGIRFFVKCLKRGRVATPQQTQQFHTVQHQLKIVQFMTCILYI